MAAASQSTSGKVLPSDGFVAKRDDEGSPIANPASQRERARATGISKRTQEKLDRLARDHKQLHSQVSAGELSVYRACVEAEIVKTKTLVERITALLAKCTDEERQAALEWPG